MERMGPQHMSSCYSRGPSAGDASGMELVFEVPAEIAILKKLGPERELLTLQLVVL